MTTLTRVNQQTSLKFYIEDLKRIVKKLRTLKELFDTNDIFNDFRPSEEELALVKDIKESFTELERNRRQHSDYDGRLAYLDLLRTVDGADYISDFHFRNPDVFDATRETLIEDNSRFAAFADFFYMHASILNDELSLIFRRVQTMERYEQMPSFHDALCRAFGAGDNIMQALEEFPDRFNPEIERTVANLATILDGCPTVAELPADSQPVLPTEMMFK